MGVGRWALGAGAEKSCKDLRCSDCDRLRPDLLEKRRRNRGRRGRRRSELRAQGLLGPGLDCERSPHPRLLSLCLVSLKNTTLGLRTPCRISCCGTGHQQRSRFTIGARLTKISDRRTAFEDKVGKAERGKREPAERKSAEYLGHSTQQPWTIAAKRSEQKRSAGKRKQKNNTQKVRARHRCRRKIVHGKGTSRGCNQSARVEMRNRAPPRA